MTFLGHIITSEGVSIDLHKTSYCELGAANQCGKFRVSSVWPVIYVDLWKGFYALLASLAKLTRKNAPFMWTNECKRSFQKLKDNLTTTPILTLPSGGNDFVIYSDASNKRLGCPLMQHKSSPILLDNLRIMNKAVPLMTWNWYPLFLHEKHGDSTCMEINLRYLPTIGVSKYILDQKELHMRQKK